MLYTSTIISILEVLVVLLPSLLTVAFVTVAERKTMASMQRRLGPNVVGYYGLLQAFADALKLLLKEYISPTQANTILFFMGPIITLVFSLLGYAIIPYGPGLVIWDLDLGILYMLAVSSLATYGILLAGWSANSKYAFLGSLRSTAQLISYELILSSAILIVIFITGSLNFTINIEIQKSIWLIFPLLPAFIIFFIGSIAETNRAPFDLAEAESELVSGFMTEHAAVIFVFFFLAEYASIVLMCILTAILFLGGYLLPSFDFFNTGINISSINNDSYLHGHTSSEILTVYSDYYKNNENQFELIDNNHSLEFMNTSEFTQNIDRVEYYYHENISLNNIFMHLNPDTRDNYIRAILEWYTVEGIIYTVVIGLKSSLMVFVFIWVRASLPRIRFDQLMSYSWTVLLPIVVSTIIIIPCIIYNFDIISNNINVI